MRVLGVDPGFASCGIVRVVIRGSLERPGDVELMKTLRTQPSAKKLKRLVSDDNLRRVRELSRTLSNHVAWSQVVCCESFSPPRNASSGAKVAFVWGALVALCEAHGRPLLQATPQAIKKALTGRRDAAKRQLQEALDLHYGEANVLDAMHQTPPGQYEHPYDALAAVHTCLDSEEVRLLWNVTSAGTNDNREGGLPWPREEQTTDADVHPKAGVRLRSQTPKPREQVRERARSSRFGGSNLPSD